MKKILSLLLAVQVMFAASISFATETEAPKAVSENCASNSYIVAMDNRIPLDFVLSFQEFEGIFQVLLAPSTPGAEEPHLVGLLSDPESDQEVIQVQKDVANYIEEELNTINQDLGGEYLVILCME